MPRRWRRPWPAAAALALAAGASPALAEAQRPLALRVAKLLTCAGDAGAPQVIDDALVVLRDGRFAAVGPADELEPPPDAELVDLRPAWAMPGMVDLHSHVGGPPDWARAVYLVNPGQRIAPGVVPGNRLLELGLAGGVTTVLHIPGSATNMGGQGVLMKTRAGTYEEVLLRDPGSLKIAQAGNPESWTVGVGRTFMNWNLRHTIRRGLSYAAAWRRFELGEGSRPELDPQWEVFRALAEKRTQVSVHTQIYQVVLTTLTMLRRELGLDVYLDHGSFDGWRAAELAEELGVPAILGPRSICYSVNVTVGGPAPWPLQVDTDGRVLGIAALYQEAGHGAIGFNTDAVDERLGGNVHAEELSLQAGLAVRYGFANERLEAVRGLTIVPARAAGLAHRLGSVEPGRDADLVVLSGDPVDPRTEITAVYVDGVLRGP